MDGVANEWTKYMLNIKLFSAEEISLLLPQWSDDSIVACLPACVWCGWNAARMKKRMINLKCMNFNFAREFFLTLYRVFKWLLCGLCVRHARMEFNWINNVIMGILPIFCCCCCLQLLEWSGRRKRDGQSVRYQKILKEVCKCQRCGIVFARII